MLRVNEQRQKTCPLALYDAATGSSALRDVDVENKANAREGPDDEPHYFRAGELRAQSRYHT